MSEADKARVFLSYAHEDLAIVRKIYTGLKERNLAVWFDKEDLGPGLWKRKIEKAIPKSRYFVICISKAALKKTGNEPGFQDEELQQAYEIARVQPEDAFTIVPIRLEDCGRGDHRLSPHQQYDLFNDLEAGMDKLAVDLGGISLSNRLLEDTRNDDEKIIDMLDGKAIAHYYAGDLGKSLDVFTSIILSYPDYPVAWRRKGAVLSNLGRQEEAIEAYDKSMDLYSAHFGRKTESGRVVMGARPEYGEIMASRGHSLYAIGRNDDAIESFKSAISIFEAIGAPGYADHVREQLAELKAEMQ